MKKAKAFVLLSGGIDSTTCLQIAEREFGGHVEGVSVNYGQRHVREIDCAKASCDRIGCAHSVLDIPNVIPSTMLTDESIAVPNISYKEIEGVSPTYVPFRNGLLLSAATAYAQKHGVQGCENAIYFGAHAEDAHNWAYPDCTPEFIGAMANAIYLGTYGTVRLHTPIMWLNKSEVIQLGDKLGVDFSMTWSCYVGGEKHCGVCPTCRARRTAFGDAHVIDPTEYAQQAA